MPETTTDALRALYERRHPAYVELLPHWLFLEAAYRGGRAWFQDNIFKYHKEGEAEFQKRLTRAYRFNHTREVVELVQKYLFKSEISRAETAPQVIKDFWKNTTLDGVSISQFMRNASASSSIGGRSAIVVDTNFRPVVDENGKTRPTSIADIKSAKTRIYAYVVPAKDILDYAFDETGDGGLLWVKLREFYRDDADPINSTGDTEYRVRLWTRENWTLYREIDTGRTISIAGKRQPEKKVIVQDSGEHNLGVVPVVFVDHTISSEPYSVPGLIDDIAYLDRSIANYLSNLDAIIQDQTFSQLAIPAQALQAGDDLYTKVLELGTKRVFVYDAGQGSSAKPEYLSPDPKQAGVILAVINKIINEIYHTIGLAGERTKQDNAVGIDNSSGVAKAYDFERVNSLLLNKAQACETAENKLVELVLRYAGEDPESIDAPLVTYPRSFDITQLSDDLVMSETLMKVNAPIELRRQQMRDLVDKMFPQLKDDLRAKISKDIDSWLEGTDVLPLGPTSFGGAKKPAAAPNRQGEVTKSTPNAATAKP